MFEIPEWMLAFSVMIGTIAALAALTLIGRIIEVAKVVSGQKPIDQTLWSLRMGEVPMRALVLLAIGTMLIFGGLSGLNTWGP